MDKLIFIIPIFNAEIYLKKCIDSIILQMNKNSIIICVDNGSTDNSNNIMKEYVKKYPANIIALESGKESLGSVSKARNEALLYIKENMSDEEYYLTFIDSDDTLTDTFTKKMEKVRNCRYDIIAYNYQTIDAKGNLIHRQSKERTLFQMKYMTKTVWSYIFNIKLLLANDNLYFNESMVCFEDGVFNLKLFALTDSCYFIGEALYNYRIYDTVDRNLHNRLERSPQSLEIYFATIHEFYQMASTNEEKRIILYSALEIYYFAIRFRFKTEKKEVKEKEFERYFKVICKYFQNYKKLPIWSILFEKNAEENIYKFIMVCIIVIDRILPLEKFKKIMLK